jgi:hypothetical protein
VGLAVASGQATTFSVAAFDEVTVREVSSAALPNAWDARDIGGPAFEGRSLYENGTFAIAAGGRDIGGKADQFHYVYTPAAGDVDVIARLATTERHTSMKAGVMIRASLDAKSPHAFMFTSATKRFDFRRRLVTGGKTKQATGNPAGIPSWVKLERRGALVSAYSSLDGNTWTFVGNELMELPASFLVGLAVSGGSSTPFAVAAFDRVEVRTTQPAPAPEPPAPTPPKPKPSKPKPSKPKPSKPAPPTEDPEPAPSVPQPRRVVFEPSSDHHTNVDRYTLEVVRAGAASVTLLEKNLGKPSIVNGECVVDVAAVLGRLPPGKYIAIVRAANAKGRSAGATASFEVSR